jgi:Pyruvate/2-oxoacid:ferredoxin oxidoreductase delta subunit
MDTLCQKCQQIYSHAAHILAMNTAEAKKHHFKGQFWTRQQWKHNVETSQCHLCTIFCWKHSTNPAQLISEKASPDDLLEFRVSGSAPSDIGHGSIRAEIRGGAGGGYFFADLSRISPAQGRRTVLHSFYMKIFCICG